MAVSLSSTINSFLNPYAQTALQAAQARNGVDPIRPGATLTARYTVQEDGQLALRDVNLVDESSDSTSGQQGQQQQALAERDRRPASFADIARPRALLQPADEAAIFAAALPPAGRTLLLPSPTVAGGANGAGITDIAFEDAQPAAEQDLAARQQLRVANLYARNADVTYNVDPVFSAAA